jgi:predicted thioesterase
VGNVARRLELAQLQEAAACRLAHEFLDTRDEHAGKHVQSSHYAPRTWPLPVRAR